MSYLCRNVQPKPTSQEERALTGTWVSVELFKALDLGYRLLEVYEIYNHPKTKHYYKGDETQKEMCADYVDAFFSN